MNPELRQIVIATRHQELRAEAAAHRLGRADPLAAPATPHPARITHLLRRLAGMPTFA